MRSYIRSLVPVVLCSALLSTPSLAAVTLSVDNTAPLGVAAIDNFQTTGALMDGMLVTARIRTATGGIVDETLAWADTGPAAGGVAGTGWSLNLDGDTFGAPWTFALDDGLSLLSLRLDGVAGLTFFDRTEPSPGTDGSSGGRDLGGFIPELTGEALYSMPIFLTGLDPQFDLYGMLFMDFGQAGVSVDFTFQQDTDNDIRRSQVPEPASLVLLGAGLAGLGLTRRRKLNA